MDTAQNNQDTFFKRLEEHHQELSMKQMRLAEYLKANYKTAVFLNCVPLGKNAGVSEATVIRLAQTLGYSGFTEMINHIKSFVQDKMTVSEKFDGYEKSTMQHSPYDVILDTNLHLLKTLPRHISSEQVSNVVFKMMKANKVIVCAFEGLAGLGEFLVYHLRAVGCKAELVTEKSGRLFDFYNDFQEGTCVIDIDFAPYAKNQLKITELFAKKGAEFCIITDSPRSPLAKYGSDVIYIPFVRNLIDLNIERYPVVLAVFEVMVFQYAYCNSEKTKETLKSISEYNKVFDVLEFEKEQE